MKIKLPKIEGYRWGELFFEAIYNDYCVPQIKKDDKAAEEIVAENLKVIDDKELQALINRILKKDNTSKMA